MYYTRYHNGNLGNHKMFVKVLIYITVEKLW